MLVHLYDEETLETELRVRCLEVQTTLRSDLAKYYGDQVEKLTNEKSHDLQWRYTVTAVRGRYSQDITRRTVEFFALALLVVWTV